MEHPTHCTPYFISIVTDIKCADSFVFISLTNQMIMKTNVNRLLTEFVLTLKNYLLKGNVMIIQQK